MTAERWPPASSSDWLTLRAAVAIPRRDEAEMTVYLETARVQLRRFTVDDIDRLFELDSDPEVMRYISGGVPTSSAEIAGDYLPAFLAYYDRGPDFGFWAAYERATDTFIGWFHLRPAPDHPASEPEVGYRLRRAAWGRGYATEVTRALVDHSFDALGASSVLAMAFRENGASRRVMEKAGLRLAREERAPDELLLEMLGTTEPDSLSGDVVEYRITRAEWVAAGANR